MSVRHWLPDRTMPVDEQAGGQEKKVKAFGNAYKFARQRSGTELPDEENMAADTYSAKIQDACRFSCREFNRAVTDMYALRNNA